MTQIHLVGVLVRLFAAYVIVSTIQVMPQFISGVRTYGADTSTIVISGAMLASLLLAAILLWVFHLAVARRFFFSDRGEEALKMDGVQHLEGALFSVVGLWFLVSGIADLVYWGSIINLVADGDLNLVPQKASAGSSLVQIVMGAALLLRGRSIQNILARIRG